MEQNYPLDLSLRSSNLTKIPEIIPDKTRKKSNHRRVNLRCNQCNKIFDRPSLLMRHTRTHTGEKPFTCNVCKKSFSTSSSLNTHHRIHTGEKPHNCPICLKSFTASSNLYYHRMTHSKVRI